MVLLYEGIGHLFCIGRLKLQGRQSPDGLSVSPFGAFRLFGGLCIQAALIEFGSFLQVLRLHSLRHHKCYSHRCD